MTFYLCYRSRILRRVLKGRTEFSCQVYNTHNYSQVQSQPSYQMECVQTLTSPTNNRGKTYQDSLRELGNLSDFKPFDRKPGNDRIVFLEYLRRIGYTIDVFDRFNVIHITGTKGKGSTCAFVDSIMKRVILKTQTETRMINTGMFTSPHLVSPTERIKINNKSISGESFSKLFFSIKDKLLDERWKDNSKIDIPTIPPYFHYCFLMAIEKFVQEKIDVAIVEVGVGGEYDLTNVIKNPLVCAVSLIGYDHENTLGSTLEEIAWQKAGIFKPGCRALTTSVQKREVLKVIESRAKEAGVHTYNIINPDTIDGVELGIEGIHQRQNAALAVEIVRAWCETINSYRSKSAKIEISDNEIKEGLRCTTWQGRTHMLKIEDLKNIIFYLDGAHNIDSIQACVTWFNGKMLEYKNEKLNNFTKCLIFNLTGKRSFLNVVSDLISYHNQDPFDVVIFTTNNVHSPGETSLQENMAEIWKTHTIHSHVAVFVECSISDSINRIIKLSEQEGHKSREISVLITGSLYLVGGTLEVLDVTIN